MFSRWLLAVMVVASAAMALAVVPHREQGGPRPWSGGAPIDAPHRGVFLVASDGISDPRFRQAVILVLEHDSSGSVGLIVNRRTDVELGSLVPELGERDRLGRPVYLGGPVAGGGLMLLTTDDVSDGHGTAILEDVRIGNEERVLDEVLREGIADDQARIYVGFCGWGPGQLDSELRTGGWHVVPADSNEVFSPHPESLWRRLMEHRVKRGLMVRGAGSDWVRI